MALVEDAASLLEMWTQDVANLPAEMSHLMEEIEAKDKLVAEHRLAITQRDLAIQKHIKAHGMTVLTPREEYVCKTVDGHFGNAITIQNEKVALAEKARVLLDRHVKRLDVQIRQLEDAGFMPPDPQLPSIISNDSLAPGNMLASNSRLNGGALMPISGNAVDLPVHPSTTIANSNIARLVTNGANNVNGSRSPRAASPNVASASAVLINRGTRESSIDSNKRRKLNLPSQNSSLRQSSLGPNIPASQNGLNGTKAKDQSSLNNVVSAGSQQRSNSVGARGLPKKLSKSSSLVPSAKTTHLHPGMAKKSGSRRKTARKNGVKASMSDTGDESALSEIDGSDVERNSAADGVSGRDSKIAVLTKPNISSDMAVDEDEDAGDDKKYCVCQSISYGNMVACDNPDCKNEWFHWQCVGITKEPVGKWYCPACKDSFAVKA